LPGCWLCRCVEFAGTSCTVGITNGLFSWVGIQFCRFLSSFQKMNFEKLPHF